MEVRSFPALLSAAIQIKKPCEPKFNLDCLLMEVAGANPDYRCQLSARISVVSYRRFRVAQLL